MPIRVSCPCGATLNAPDAAAGKQVKCPKCSAAVPVPDAEAGFEVVDEAPAPAKKPAVAKALPLPAKKPAVIDAEVADAPKPKYKPRAVEDDDGDEDDRPRKRAGKKGKKKGPPVLLLAAAGGGVLLLGVLAVVGYLLFGGNSNGLPGVAPMADDGPPAGFSALRDDKAGYRVFVPGQAQVLDSEEALRRSNAPNAAQMREKLRAAPYTSNMITPSGFAGLGSVRVGGRATMYKDFKPGTSRQMLLDELKKVAISMDAKWNFPPEVAEVRLDGRPALVVRVKKNELWMQTGAGEGHTEVMKDAPKDFQDRAKKQDDDWNARQAQQAAGRAAQTEHHVYIVTVTEKAAVVIELQSAGQYVDDATLKVVTDSFKFL